MLSETLCPPASLPLRTWSGKTSSVDLKTTPHCLNPFLTSITHEISLFHRNKYATFKEIRTRTITVAGSRGDSKKAKLFITLQRGPDFTENMRKFSEIKLENEKLAAKNAENNPATEEVPASTEK